MKRATVHLDCSSRLRLFQSLPLHMYLGLAHRVWLASRLRAALALVCQETWSEQQLLKLR